MNNIEVTGRLTKDPKIKYTATGVAVAKFRLAENLYNKKEGKPKRRWATTRNKKCA